MEGWVCLVGLAGIEPASWSSCQLVTHNHFPPSYLNLLDLIYHSITDWAEIRFSRSTILMFFLKFGNIWKYPLHNPSHELLYILRYNTYRSSCTSSWNLHDITSEGKVDSAKNLKYCYFLYYYFFSFFIYKACNFLIFMWTVKFFNAVNNIINKYINNSI